MSWCSHGAADDLYDINLTSSELIIMGENFLKLFVVNDFSVRIFIKFKNATEILNVWVSKFESLYFFSMVHCEHYFTYKFKPSTPEHFFIVLLIFKFYLFTHLFLVGRQFLLRLSSIFYTCHLSPHFLMSLSNSSLEEPSKVLIHSIAFPLSLFFSSCLREVHLENFGE